MGEGEPEAEEENVAGAAAVAAVTSGTTDSMPKPQNRRLAPDVRSPRGPDCKGEMSVMAGDPAAHAHYVHLRSFSSFELLWQALADQDYSCG